MTNQAKFPDYAFKCEDWKYDETKIPDDKKCLLVMDPKYICFSSSRIGLTNLKMVFCFQMHRTNR